MRKAWCIIALVILISFGINGLFLFGDMDMTTVHPSDNTTMVCVWFEYVNPRPEFGDYIMNIFPYIDAILYCFLPVISLIVLNSLIIYHLRKSRQKHTNSKTHIETQVTIMLLLVTTIYVAMVTPLTAANIILAVDPEMLSQTMIIISSNLTYVNHSVNIILYVIGSTQFRRELIAFLVAFCCCGRRVQNDDATRSSSRKQSRSTRAGSERH